MHINNTINLINFKEELFKKFEIEEDEKKTNAFVKLKKNIKCNLEVEFYIFKKIKNVLIVFNYF